MAASGMAASMEQKFRVLSRVLAVATATLPLEERLAEAVKAVAHGLEADLCGVLLLGRNDDGLKVAAINDPLFLDDLGAAVSNGGLLEMLTAQGKNQTAAAVQGLPGARQTLPPIVSWPLRDENFLYGALCLGDRAGRPDPPEDLLDAVRRELVAAVRSARHYEMAKRQVAELNVLLEVGRRVTSTIELDELLKIVVTIVPKIARAKACAMGFADRRSGELRIVSMVAGSDVRVFRQSGGEEDWKHLRAELSERLKSLGQEPRLCMPLTFMSDVEGQLCICGLEDPTGVANNKLLAGVAAIVSSTLENAVIFRQIGELAERNQRMVRLLTTFYEFSQALMTTVRFEDRQRVILRALTLPQGLRFGRAMLMLTDEDEAVVRVRGALAAAPRPARGRSQRGLAELLTSVDQTVVREFPEAQDFEVKLERETDVFAATVLQGRAQLVNDPERDPRTDSAFVQRFGRCPFATVPIRVKGKVTGLIYVDHAPGGGCVEERDLQSLSMLANLAGLGIDNAMLYEHVKNTMNELKAARERMLETEKLAALGELAAGMAHEIRNPLVSIGGFTRRVDRTVEESSPLKPYLAVIINEVEKLEKTLGEILTFSGEGQDHFAPHDMNRVVEEAMALLKREFDETRIVVRREYDKLPAINCDSRQLKHVFFNLFLNAKQAMGNSGCLTIRTGFEPGDTPRVWCEVSDTGTGILPNLMHNIFNPFFTTKDKGSGLGLSIAHRIMTRHRGEIAVTNNPGGGAAFTVKLPLAQA
ncbi:MAG: ATP-binding protein [Pseudomonadota bacterium]